MATTVNLAFAEFLKDTVNLDPDDTSGARKSKKWLRDRLDEFYLSDAAFPRPYPAQHMDFGSFARRTKIRPLDDVDLIHCIAADGATYLDVGSHVEITVRAGTRLAAFCHDWPSQHLLNSRKVINQYVRSIKNVHQYSSSDPHRNGEAATLVLTSYDWNFDIVPGFFTTANHNGDTYYIIPDGNGHWQKTDPRIDQGRVTKVNQDNDGYILNVIRLLKYWNRRPTMPSVSSYLLEAMVLDAYASRKATQWPDCEVAPVLDHIATAVWNSVNDPKGIQGDINALDFEVKRKVSDRAQHDAKRARSALASETQGDQREAVRKWGDVFGSDFPKYG